MKGSRVCSHRSFFLLAEVLDTAHLHLETRFNSSSIGMVILKCVQPNFRRSAATIFAPYDALLLEDVLPDAAANVPAERDQPAIWKTYHRMCNFRARTPSNWEEDSLSQSLQFFTHCSLPGLKESSDQFAFTTHNHSGKSLEPLSIGNFRLCGQPVSQQAKLINRNVAALNALQQVRP
jgi:hypothetical protein